MKIKIVFFLFFGALFHDDVVLVEGLIVYGQGFEACVCRLLL